MQNSKINFKMKIVGEKELISGDQPGVEFERMMISLDALFNQPTPKLRTIKIHTNEAGVKLFQQALQTELNKKSKSIANEYRKGTNIPNKINKQTRKRR